MGRFVLGVKNGMGCFVPRCFVGLRVVSSTAYIQVHFRHHFIMGANNIIQIRLPGLGQ